MRSGYEDTSLFKENLLAAQESGAWYVTLHPRTKVDGYGPPANWDLIAEAKRLLKIPVVGNGDILTVADALRMLKTTGCDALMIGRGSVINPFIFHQIRAHFSQQTYEPQWESLKLYLNVYASEIEESMPIKIKINKFKQLMSFLFKGNERLLEKRQSILTSRPPDLGTFLDFAMPILEENWMK
jgi:tRNA-dihydrouridine synthase C